jgi:3-oxoadipate enol-lactonase
MALVRSLEERYTPMVMNLVVADSEQDLDGPLGVPPWQVLELPGRGDLPIRVFPGPPGAPTVLLLHGWTATADLNWFTSYQALAARYQVVAFDHRGHGTGLRSRRPFRLEDCADDAVAVLDALGIEQAITIGYSMGGPVAQLVWKRHRERVAGLVLCATAAHFVERPEHRIPFLGMTGLAALARVTPSQARTWLSEQIYLQRKTVQWEPWAVAQASSHDWRMILEAGSAIGNYSATSWITEISVPTSVVVTMRDPVVPLSRQLKMLEHLPHAEVFRVDGDHAVVVTDSARFLPGLLRSVAAVAPETLS